MELKLEKAHNFGLSNTSVKVKVISNNSHTQFLIFLFFSIKGNSILETKTLDDCCLLSLLLLFLLIPSCHRLQWGDRRIACCHCNKVIVRDLLWFPSVTQLFQILHHLLPHIMSPLFRVNFPSLLNSKHVLFPCHITFVLLYLIFNTLFPWIQMCHLCPNLSVIQLSFHLDPCPNTHTQTCFPCLPLSTMFPKQSSLLLTCC